MKNFNSWNNLPSSNSKREYLEFNNTDSLLALDKKVIPRGLGRSYGDVCISDNGKLILTNKLNSLLHFDINNGVIECESGVSINELLNLIVPKGWFLPVVPGTSYVTIGGAIANDIHGKNHHKLGSYGNSILSFDILRSNGEILNCSPSENKDLFSATIGGLGLTGLILSVKIQLIKINSPYMSSGSKRFYSLTEFFEMNSEMEKKHDYTVSWVDFNSKKGFRGIYLYGNHSKKQVSTSSYKTKKFSLTFPFTPPFSFVNNLTLKILNNFYFFLNKDKKNELQNYRSFFFPLDVLRNWNRAYGKKGFYQYQFVVPMESAEEVMHLVVDELHKNNHIPALSVLKTFGEIESLGLLSFPMKGLTLAIDIQNKGNKTLNLLDSLDEIILNNHGRIYPAKDCRMSSYTFNQSFKDFEKFCKFVDPKFSSSFFERIN